MISPLAVIDEGLGNSPYIVDLDDGRALVVDPERHPGAHVDRGLSVAYSVETHLHADFVSGSRELAALGATVIAPAAAGLEFPARGLGDGDEVDLGGLRLRAAVVANVVAGSHHDARPRDLHVRDLTVRHNDEVPGQRPGTSSMVAGARASR